MLPLSSPALPLQPSMSRSLLRHSIYVTVYFSLVCLSALRFLSKKITFPVRGTSQQKLRATVFFTVATRLLVFRHRAGPLVLVSGALATPRGLMLLLDLCHATRSDVGTTVLITV